MPYDDPNWNCKNCFFSAPAGTDLACHRWPPIQGWPVVSPVAWCGEFKRKIEKEMA
jgi:hypothetical protein